MAWRPRCVQAEQNDEWQQVTSRSAAVAVTRRSRRREGSQHSASVPRCERALRSFEAKSSGGG